MCTVKMFKAWLRVDTNATCVKLARALVDVGKRNIAEAMCTARGTDHEPYVHTLLGLGDIIVLTVVDLDVSNSDW